MYVNNLCCFRAAGGTQQACVGSPDQSTHCYNTSSWSLHHVSGGRLYYDECLPSSKEVLCVLLIIV